MLITLSIPFRALIEIRKRRYALRHLPLPTGLGTQMVCLRGKCPSQFSNIE